MNKQEEQEFRDSLTPEKRETYDELNQGFIGILRLGARANHLRKNFGENFEEIMGKGKER